MSVCAGRSRSQIAFFCWRSTRQLTSAFWSFCGLMLVWVRLLVLVMLVGRSLPYEKSIFARPSTCGPFLLLRVELVYVGPKKRRLIFGSFEGTTACNHGDDPSFLPMRLGSNRRHGPGGTRNSYASKGQLRRERGRERTCSSWRRQRGRKPFGAGLGCGGFFLLVPPFLRYKRTVCRRELRRGFVGQTSSSAVELITFAVAAPSTGATIRPTLPSVADCRRVLLFRLVRACCEICFFFCACFLLFTYLNCLFNRFFVCCCSSI